MIHPKLTSLIPWEQIDLTAQQQIITVLAMPNLIQLSIMPDVHAGYFLCIGGVALMQDVVVPAFVGFDIGCGMCHINTGKTLQQLSLTNTKQRQQLFKDLLQYIPAGLGKNHAKATSLTAYGSKAINTEAAFSFTSACRAVPNLSVTDTKALDHLERTIKTAAPSQLGTLGSGNHFLEIGVNSKGHVGITIHSGSRRSGYDIASFYMKKHTFLPVNSGYGAAYLADLNWALDYALLNRKVMLLRALTCLGFSVTESAAYLQDTSFINENHNHAEHTQNNTVLHRKGATPAQKGQAGIIPANQKDGVYITKGLGNSTYLCSASHGAGRLYSRTAAKKQGSVDEFKKIMGDIVCRTDSAILDEAPWAYKNCLQVIAMQQGIVVDITDHFTPIVVVKGS